MSSLRKLIKQFVKIVSETLPISEPIFEFGSLQVPGQEGSADMRPLFPDKEYVGCDMRAGPGVDRILNLHNIELPSESVGTILILDTLEHVEDPRSALGEVYRVLKPDGIAVVTSVMNFPIHEFPFDYWRFTPDGFKSLLKNFAYQYIDFAGDKLFPHTIIGVAFKDSVADDALLEFKTKSANWKKQWTGIGGFLRRVSLFMKQRLIERLSVTRQTKHESSK